MKTRTKRIIVISLALIAVNLLFPPRHHAETGRSLSRGVILSDTSEVKNSFVGLTSGRKTEYFYNASLSTGVLFTQCALIVVLGSLLIIIPAKPDEQK
jgi:hypothetical protein